jgi:hypothetical protein
MAKQPAHTPIPASQPTSSLKPVHWLIIIGVPLLVALVLVIIIVAVDPKGNKSPIGVQPPDNQPPGNPLAPPQPQAAIPGNSPIESGLVNPKDFRESAGLITAEIWGLRNAVEVQPAIQRLQKRLSISKGLQVEWTLRPRGITSKGLVLHTADVSNDDLLTLYCREGTQTENFIPWDRLPAGLQQYIGEKQEQRRREAESLGIPPAALANVRLKSVTIKATIDDIRLSFAHDTPCAMFLRNCQVTAWK